MVAEQFRVGLACCSDVWSQPRCSMGAGRSAQVLQRLQILETVVVKQLDRTLSKVQKGIALCWTTVTTTIGQVVDTLILGEADKRDWQRKCMAQVELHDESARCGRRSATIRCRDQFGCGKQRAAWRSAVVCRLDHVVHGKRLKSHRKCLVKLEYGSVAISLSDVFSEERRKVGCADDGGTGSFFGHERCGGRSWRRNGRRRDLFKIIQRCFREFWNKQGLKVRVLVLREATVRMSQETDEPRHGTVEKQRMEQERVQVLSRVRQLWSGCEIQRSKRVRSKQEKLGRNEMRRLGERRSECAGDWSSVVAREKSQDSGWNQFACCSDCVRSFSLIRNEKLQVLCGSECSKGERQVQRCVILVRGSENGRDVRTLGGAGGSVRERHGSRCVFPCHDEGTQACAYHEGCGTKLELELNGVFELPILRPPIAQPTVQLLESERPQREF